MQLIIISLDVFILQNIKIFAFFGTLIKSYQVKNLYVY